MLEKYFSKLYRYYYQDYFKQFLCDFRNVLKLFYFIAQSIACMKRYSKIDNKQTTNMI